MKAAVLWRDLGQVQLAVLEVRFAMAERQLAQLERGRARLETAADAPAERFQAVAGDSNATAEADRERTASTKGAVEVLYAEDRWYVVWDGEPEADSTHQFRIAAIAIGHERARRARSELVVRGRDGTPREHVSYREDPIEKKVIYRRPQLRRA